MEVQEIKEQLKDMFRTVLNDKWITVHPHGEDEKGQHLLIKDGENLNDAMRRQWGAQTAGQQNLFTAKERKSFELEKEPKIDKQEAKIQKEIAEAKRLHPDMLNVEEYVRAKYNQQKPEGLSKEDKEFTKELDKQVKESAAKEGEKLDKVIEEDYLIKDNEAAKRGLSEQANQPDKKETLKDNNSIEQFLTDKSDSGFLYTSKGTNTYTNGDKKAEVEEFGDEGGKYRVVFKNGNRTKDIKAYSTKAGMEKAVKKHLIDDAAAEKTPIEKTNLEEKENTYKEVLKRYNENNRKRWSSGLSNAEYHKAWEEAEKAKKELTTARREYAESIMANFETVESNPYEEKQAARRERYEELSDKAQKSSDSYAKTGKEMFDVIPFGQPIHGQRDRNYRDNAWGKFEKSWKEQEKANYYADKAASVGKAGISADDANAIAKLARKYKSGVTSAEKRRIIDRVIDIHKNRQMAGDTSKQTDYSNLGFQVERNTDINRLQLKFDGKPEANVRSILKSNGFRWSPREGAWQRQLGGNSESGLNRVVEQLKNINNSLLDGLDEILKQDDFTADELKIINCINEILDPTVNNNKEQDMALLEEIKKLITRVENNKENEMEIENAKVDKRDIIRQIMAIAGKEEASEDVRTIAKLAEKLAYDESEAGTADNEMDKEDPDDEKEVKEVKEEVKEDVENKCKNSVDNSKTDYFAEMNKIYNAAQEAKKENIYISQAQREQDAVDYFKK